MSNKSRARFTSKWENPTEGVQQELDSVGREIRSELDFDASETNVQPSDKAKLVRVDGMWFRETPDKSIEKELVFQLSVEAVSKEYSIPWDPESEYYKGKIEQFFKIFGVGSDNPKDIIQREAYLIDTKGFTRLATYDSFLSNSVFPVKFRYMDKIAVGMTLGSIIPLILGYPLVFLAILCLLVVYISSPHLINWVNPMYSLPIREFE